MAKVAGSLAGRAVLNAGGSALIGVGAQAANNSFDPCKKLTDGLGRADLLNGVLGGLGSATGDKIARGVDAALAARAIAGATLSQRLLQAGGTITSPTISNTLGSGIGNGVGTVISNSGSLF